MEALPDLASLSDAELKELIKQLEAEENEISYRRRLLHGKLDILRAELVARLQQKGEGELAQVDLDRLTDILAGKAAPPSGTLSHIYCPECGFQNMESAHYCSRCGALLVVESEPDETTMTISAEEVQDEHADLLEELGVEARRSSSGREAGGPARCSRSTSPRHDRPLAGLRHLSRRRDRLAATRGSWPAVKERSRSRIPAA